MLGPYLDPHCTFFSKIKSADICKDWNRGLTKMSGQRLRFKLKNKIQEYNADRKMRQKNHENSGFRPNPYQHK